MRTFSAWAENSGLPAAVVHRLSQLAAVGGRAEVARGLADAIPDEGLRLWARGDAVRFAPAGAADEAVVPVPDNPKDVRAGHAWGRLAVARQNTRANRDVEKERKAADGWGKPLRGFGLAGIGLGLKDR